MPNAAPAQTGKVVVIMPTFNEAQTLPPVVAAVRAALPTASVLVVDDASPDGTGAIADALAAGDPQVRVLHRSGRSGLKAAYAAGMHLALQDGAEVVVQMDADGSHPAAVLPELVAALREPGVGLAIGSRYVPGGAIEGWSRHRSWLSRTANRFARWALRLPVHDVTAGFRAWSAATLEAVQIDTVASRGYCVQIDLTRRASAITSIQEVPIVFRERLAGESKMTLGIVFEAAVRVLGWSLRPNSRITMTR